MDEQRFQAYTALIEQLLGCPQGQEAEILQAQDELVDAGLLAVMEQVAAYLESQGSSNAGWLRELAAQLAQALGLGKEQATVRAAGIVAAAQFLMETLQLVDASEGNPQHVYPVWAQQQARFNADLLVVLPSVVARLFTQNTEQLTLVASVLVRFGDLINQFPLGTHTQWLNLEIGIAAYEQALQAYTREAFPEDWAATQNNLANAYYNRIRGERADNLEQAIAAYERALQVRIREAFPEDWAATQNNLGNDYRDRIRGNRAENLERAIAASEQTLQVYTRSAFPEDWAMTQNNLANAYRDRIRGDQADNLERAITASEQALQVYTREAFPQDWAGMQNNLAAAYRSRIRGKQTDNLEQAIAAYEQALQVLTREAFPRDWAMTQHNLANAYRDRIRGDRADNLEQAIAAYKQALQVYTREAFPQDCRRTARNLGTLYFEQQAWTKAVSTYETALSAAEALYQACILLDGKAAELAETADLLRRAAYAYAKIGNLQKAVEVIEQGRARGLSESLDRDRANLIQLQQTTPELYQHYQDITNQLRNLESQQRDRMTSSDHHSLTPEAFRTSATNLREQLQAAIAAIRQQPGYEGFLDQPNFDDIRAALQLANPLVYLVPTSAGSLALIVTPDSITDLWLDDLTETSLQELLQNWFYAYSQSQTDHSAWLTAIDQGTRQLWQPLMEPLIRHLKTHHFHQAILIATGYLSLLPLHAAWIEDPNTPTKRHYAIDDIHFTYVPNARSLTAAQAISDRVQSDSILAIDEPKHRYKDEDTGEYQDVSPLPSSTREVHSAIATFQKSKVLRHEQATRQAVLDALPSINVLHFSCHGNANIQEPLKSGLAMTGDGESTVLTLRDFLNLKLAESDRGGIRLAILSACETGLTGSDNFEEVISLPTGLLQAGVAGVVASLWSVSDLSTMILLSRFYTLWRTQHLAPSVALRTAQQWLRDAEPNAIIEHCATFIPDLHSQKELVRSLKLDYSHPYHWSAFSYTGV